MKPIHVRGEKTEKLIYRILFRMYCYKNSNVPNGHVDSISFNCVMSVM